LDSSFPGAFACRLRGSSVSTRSLQFVLSPCLTQVSALARVTEAIGNSTVASCFCGAGAGDAARISNRAPRLLSSTVSLKSRRVGERSSSTQYFFAAAAALSPNCNMTRIHKSLGPFSAGSVETTPAYLCVAPSIDALLLPIEGAPDRLSVIYLQQIEKSQKEGEFIVCL
jgi:hypothetical protein